MMKDGDRRRHGSNKVRIGRVYTARTPIGDSLRILRGGVNPDVEQILAGAG
jgi:hypothetical protein